MDNFEKAVFGLVILSVGPVLVCLGGFAVTGTLFEWITILRVFAAWIVVLALTALSVGGI